MGIYQLRVWKSDEVNQEVTVVKNGVETKGTYASIYKVVPGQEKLLDANNDGTYNDDDQSIIGNGQPSFNWGGIILSVIKTSISHCSLSVSTASIFIM